LRNYIDGFAGVGAIVSGWDIYQSLLDNGGITLASFRVFGDENVLILRLLNYLLILVIILIISWPFIVPTVITYMSGHGKNVNSFRLGALASGIPLGIIQVRSPTIEEIKAIKH